MTRTPLDAAHAALAAVASDADDPGLRLAFYGQVMATELYLLLEAEPEGARVRPLVLDTPDGRVVLAFDLPERMAAFLGAPREYVALAGRALVGMLAGQGIGIALNPDVAPSSSVINPDAIEWLAAGAANVPVRAEQLPGPLHPPSAVPVALLRAIEARLSAYAGLVNAAYLAAATAESEDESERLVLALAGVPQAAEAAVAAAIDEALRFSGVDGVRLDVVFPSAALLARISRVAISFRPEPPQPPDPQPHDPRPPRLR